MFSQISLGRNGTILEKHIDKQLYRCRKRSHPSLEKAIAFAKMTSGVAEFGYKTCKGNAPVVARNAGRVAQGHYPYGKIIPAISNARFLC